MNLKIIRLEIEVNPLRSFMVIQGCNRKSTATMANIDEVGMIRFAAKLAKKLIADWKKVESSLQDFGISCQHKKDDKLFKGEQTTIVTRERIRILYYSRRFC